MSGLINYAREKSACDITLSVSLISCSILVHGCSEGYDRNVSVHFKVVLSTSRMRAHIHISVEPPDDIQHDVQSLEITYCHL